MFKLSFYLLLSASCIFYCSFDSITDRIQLNILCLPILSMLHWNLKFMTWLSNRRFVWIRSCIPPTGWHTAGSAPRGGSLPRAHALHYSHSSPLHRGLVDCQYSRLHSRTDMARNGCWLPHYSPHHLSTQLWPLHDLDGLDVWNSTRPTRRRCQEDLVPLVPFEISGGETVLCALQMYILSTTCWFFLFIERSWVWKRIWNSCVTLFNFSMWLWF